MLACVFVPRLNLAAARHGHALAAGRELQARAVEEHRDKDVPGVPHGRVAARRLRAATLRRIPRQEEHQAKRAGGKSRDATAAEVASDEPEDVTPEADDPEDFALDDRQGSVRDEFKALAANLGDATGDFPPEHTEALKDAALRLVRVPDALKVVRDARRQLGRGRSSGAEESESPSGGRPLGPQAGAAVPSPTRSARGRPSPCATCAAGPAIPQALAETAMTPSPLKFDEKSDDCDQDLHQAMVVHMPAASHSSGCGVRYTSGGLIDSMC